MTLRSGLIAVALNTNFYFPGNQVFANLTVEDPGNQFSMLEDLLQGARANKTKVDFISSYYMRTIGWIVYIGCRKKTARLFDCL